MVSDVLFQAEKEILRYLKDPVFEPYYREISGRLKKLVKEMRDLARAGEKARQVERARRDRLLTLAAAARRGGKQRPRLRSQG